MWRLNPRVRQTLALHFGIHLAFFMVVSWILLTPFGFDPVSVTAAGFLASILAILLEWLAAPSLVTSILKPQWIREEDEPVLYGLLQGEARRANLKVDRIGVLKAETPNALVLGTPRGPFILIFTKGLLYNLTPPEIKAVAAWAMGASRSGLLGAATMFSGLLSLSYRLSGGYMEGRVKGGMENIVDKALAALGYIPFALNVSQFVRTTRPMSTLGDENAATMTGDPASFLTAMLKVARGSVMHPKGENRTVFTPVKGLMFMDPTQAIRESSSLETAARSMGIDTIKLLGHEFVEPDMEAGEYHVFEWYTSQPGPVERFRRGVALGKSVKTPIKVGLAWIE